MRGGSAMRISPGGGESRERPSAEPQPGAEAPKRFQHLFLDCREANRSADLSPVGGCAHVEIGG